MDGPDMSLTENESITISNIPKKIHELKFKFLSLSLSLSVYTYINKNQILFT